jgi:hypothetical protein
MVNLNLEITPAIQAYLIALLFRNTRSTCLGLASLFDNISHDSLNRLLHSDFPWSRRLWEFFASKMIHPGGWLVVDDTCWQPYAKSAEAVSKVWSSGPMANAKFPWLVGCGKKVANQKSS